MIAFRSLTPANNVSVLTPFERQLVTPGRQVPDGRARQGDSVRVEPGDGVTGLLFGWTIDNNPAERILRLIAIGRKNWQFYGSVNGGKTGAVLHSILASAHRHGLNEYEYFLDVLDRLVDLGSRAEMHDLLPDRWKPKNSR